MFYERFVTRFPEVGYAETRTARVVGRRELPAGNYGFMEMFCTDPACDCRRAIIQVIEERDPGEILATINYGWESLEFYRNWYRHGEGAADLVGASLEPLGKQGPHARSLLRLFEQLLADRAYAERIPRHYELFRSAQPTLSPSRKRARSK
jgi:hypothetical protein